MGLLQMKNNKIQKPKTFFTLQQWFKVQVQSPRMILKKFVSLSKSVVLNYQKTSLYKLRKIVKTVWLFNE